MRIGFLDCKTNSKDAYPAFSELADLQADVQIEKFTCPNPFKVPAACKKLFGRQVDAIVAVVTTESDNEHEMSFLRDKIADVEIAEGKYVFLVIEDINVLDQQLKNDLDRALLEALEHAPPTPPPATGGGMDMFSMPQTSPQGQEEEEVQDFLKDDSHRLF
ncbi:hypothetical protein HY572_04485 [Candidatus Micrarchaeota archaeon]|nr:hypothetical protein [Candidatus Micrarchaeota archaeon]